MSPAELAELAALGMENFLTSFSVFLSVAIAYIVAAYIVGDKLSTLQLSIVNSSFLISTIILGYLVAANFRVFFLFASANREGVVAQSGNRPILIDFTWPIGILLGVITLGCIVFMFSVRKGDKN